MVKCCGKERKHSYSCMNGEDRAYEWCETCGSFTTIITGFLDEEEEVIGLKD